MGVTQSPIRVFVVPQGGIKNTKGKTQTYDTFEDFVEAWEEPTALPSSSKADKTRLPYFVGGALSGQRSDSNVTERTLLTLDVEADAGQQPPPKPATVRARLEREGVSFWLYTTASHTPAAPRYRVVLPLALPLTPDAAALEAATRQAATLAGVADWCKPESWVLSQPMFLPAAVGGKAPQQWHRTGKPFAPASIAKNVVDDFDEAIAKDPVLRALQRAGLYLREDTKHKGKHYITCPWDSQHGKPTADDTDSTQTVYFEAHHDGNPKPSVRCLDTTPDQDGKPHFTYRSLVNWLREEGHLHGTEENTDTAGALEDPDAFWASTGIDHMLVKVPQPLEFVFTDFMPAGRVTVLAGPGGVSKSSLALRLLLAASTGSTFGPFKAPKAVRCLYVSYEDDEQTFHQRIHKMYEALNNTVDALLYDMEKVGKNLHIRAVANDAPRWVLMRKEGKFGTPEATDRLRWLAELLRKEQVRLLVLDPAAYAHHIEENNPGEMALFMQALGRLAAEADCAVLILHHMQKAAQWATINDINAGSLRGASSISDNARSVAVLVSLSQKDAPQFGLPATHDTVSRYAVFKHVKHNHSASLGVHVFQREGPLLVPTEVHPLDPQAMAEAKEKQRDLLVEAKREQIAMRVLSWLSINGKGSTNQLKEAGKAKKEIVRDTLPWMEDQGWLRSEDGPNRATYYTATEAGREHLREQTPPAKKGRPE